MDCYGDRHRTGYRQVSPRGFRQSPDSTFGILRVYKLRRIIRGRRQASPRGLRQSPDSTFGILRDYKLLGIIRGRRQASPSGLRQSPDSTFGILRDYKLQGIKRGRRQASPRGLRQSPDSTFWTHQTMDCYGVAITLGTGLRQSPDSTFGILRDYKLLGIKRGRRQASPRGLRQSPDGKRQGPERPVNYETATSCQQRIKKEQNAATNPHGSSRKKAKATDAAVYGGGSRAMLVGSWGQSREREAEGVGSGSSGKPHINGAFVGERVDGE
ncbi:GL21969 [Drosophila persimilis]|uniref:GL21969 n=1 Tax=Drosophila persimilis TaxID=7234 RepID=B4GE73_DROPE|nr:GL21969 [Drosophila persimilis]